MTAIPSLNLRKVRNTTECDPETNGGDEHDRRVSPADATDGPAASQTPIEDYDQQESFRDYSAAPTPHTGRLDASELIGCNVYEITDVPTLQAKLVEAQRLFVALEQAYERALQQKERQVTYLARYMASTARNSNTPRQSTPSGSAREYHQQGQITASGHATSTHAVVGPSSTASSTPFMSVRSARTPIHLKHAPPKYIDTAASRMRILAADPQRREAATARGSKPAGNTLTPRAGFSQWRSVANDSGARSTTPVRNASRQAGSSTPANSSTAASPLQRGGAAQGRRPQHALTPRY